MTNTIQSSKLSNHHLPVRRHLKVVKFIDAIQAALLTAHSHVPRHKLEVNNLHFNVCAVLFIFRCPSHLYLAVFFVKSIEEFKERKTQVLLTHASDKVCISLSYGLV